MVLRIIACIIALTVVVDGSAEEIVIDGLIVVPIDRIDVPARATGVLAALDVREGQSVKKNQPLAHLDDSQATVEAERARTQLQISEKLAASTHELNAARKALERTEQMARSQSIAREMAHRKAANQIRIQAAEKSESVAGNELKRAADARRTFIDSVSQSEIDGLTLAFQRSQLETKQAFFDLEMDSLLAQSEDATTVDQKLAIDQSRLAVEKSLADQEIAKLKLKSAEHDAELAALMVKNHHITAPLEGVVLRIHRRPGQWVQLGEPVLELVRMDRLRAEGFVTQAVAEKLRSFPPITVQLEGDRSRATRTGEVVFVMPEVDPVNGDVRFWIEFDNPQRDAFPGKRLSITVLP